MSDPSTDFAASRDELRDTYARRFAGHEQSLSPRVAVPRPTVPGGCFESLITASGWLAALHLGQVTASQPKWLFCNAI
jgi:hypothetical protein